MSSSEDPGTTLERSTDDEVLEATPLATEDTDGSSLEHPDEPDVLYVPAESARRSPKYGRFGVIGGLLGLVIAVVLAQTGAIPQEQNYTRTDLSIILVGLLVPLGVLISMTLALLLDRARK